MTARTRCARLLRALAARIDPRTPRTCAACADGDHAGCMIDSPSFVCLCPHAASGRAVVPDTPPSYASGRADLQLTHRHRRPPRVEWHELHEGEQ